MRDDLWSGADSVQSILFFFFMFRACAAMYFMPVVNLPLAQDRYNVHHQTR